jgi:hypothetical protein
LQKELETAILERDNINLKLEAVLDSIGKTDMALLEKEIDNEDQRELGPLKYLAGITGWPMDKVVNWFLLLIIFVFDPLAIALVVAANFAFAQIRKPRDIVMSVPEGMEFGKSYPFPKEWITESEPTEELKKRVRENQEKLKETYPAFVEKHYTKKEDTAETTQEVEELEENYFEDLEEYLSYTREEEPLDLTYPKFVEKHYTTPKTEINTYGEDDWATPSADEEETNIITSTDNLTEEELDELSREIGKTETKEVEKPINPNQKDLENLANALNIKYEDEPPSLDRLTDTTQTLIVKRDKEDKEIESAKRTLKYKGR